MRTVRAVDTSDMRYVLLVYSDGTRDVFAAVGDEVAYTDADAVTRWANSLPDEDPLRAQLYEWLNSA